MLAYVSCLFFNYNFMCDTVSIGIGILTFWYGALVGLCILVGIIQMYVRIICDIMIKPHFFLIKPRTRSRNA